MLYGKNSASIREYFVRQEHLFESRDQRTKTGWSRKIFGNCNRAGLEKRKLFTKILKISDRLGGSLFERVKFKPGNVKVLSTITLQLAIVEPSAFETDIA